MKRFQFRLSSALLASVLVGFVLHLLYFPEAWVVETTFPLNDYPDLWPRSSPAPDFSRYIELQSRHMRKGPIAVYAYDNSSQKGALLAVLGSPEILGCRFRSNDTIEAFDMNKRVTRWRLRYSENWIVTAWRVEFAVTLALGILLIWNLTRGVTAKRKERDR